MIAHDDDGYDEARTILYGGYDRRPFLIDRVADAADVSTVIRLAREGGLGLAVRSGGHSVAGHSASDGIVLDLSGMKAIDVDVESRTAWAETGFTAAEFTSATAPASPRALERRSARQRGCERGESNSHALSGTGS